MHTTTWVCLILAVVFVFYIMWLMFAPVEGPWTEEDQEWPINHEPGAAYPVVDTRYGHSNWNEVKAKLTAEDGEES